MLIEQLPITGAEKIDEGPVAANDPHACLVGFYRAFNQRDLTGMSGNWSQSEEASMSNPLGDVRRGWLEIRSVYERIFRGPARVYVEFYDYSLHATANMFCAVGRERGYLELDSECIDLAIRTSRIYRMEDGLWKQLHHHGSIDDTTLLARYQSLVRKK